MEMIKRLHEASMEGNVTTLLELLKEDPLILDRQIISCYSETPLHIAAMLGHVEFANEILSRNPELAGERDSQQKSTPLHLAAAKGYVEIVKALLLVNSETCLASDRNGRNPLHIAAIKGRISVLKELVRARPQAVQVRVMADQGETILHMCVKHNQLEALVVLVETLGGDREFLNSKDDYGNTILHVAVADKQIETIKFLISSNTGVDVNAQNANGYTAIDILAQSRKDVNDMVIFESLQLVGALRAKDLLSSSAKFPPTRTREDPHNEQVEDLDHQQSGKNNREKWLEEKRNTLMLVASLLATMTFAAGVNPPGGVWQDTKGQEGDQKPHRAGYSILAHYSPYGFNTFLIGNTTSCFSSLSMILLLISGLPIRRRIYMWFFMVIMWIAITSAAVAYAYSAAAFTPTDDGIEIAIFAWVALMCLLLLGHTIRLIVKMIKWFIRFVRRHRDRSSDTMMNRGSV